MMGMNRWFYCYSLVLGIYLLSYRLLALIHESSHLLLLWIWNASPQLTKVSIFGGISFHFDGDLKTWQVCLINAVGCVASILVGAIIGMSAKLFRSQSLLTLFLKSLSWLFIACSLNQMMLDIYSGWSDWKFVYKLYFDYRWPIIIGLILLNSLICLRYGRILMSHFNQWFHDEAKSRVSIFTLFLTTFMAAQVSIQGIMALEDYISPGLIRSPSEVSESVKHSELAVDDVPEKEMAMDGVRATLLRIWYGNFPMNNVPYAQNILFVIIGGWRFKTQSHVKSEYQPGSSQLIILYTTLALVLLAFAIVKQSVF